MQLTRALLTLPHHTSALLEERVLRAGTLTLSSARMVIAPQELPHAQLVGGIVLFVKVRNQSEWQFLQCVVIIDDISVLSSPTSALTSIENKTCNA